MNLFTVFNKYKNQFFFNICQKITGYWAAIKLMFLGLKIH
jgi:hypothetical protein